MLLAMREKDVVDISLTFGFPMQIYSVYGAVPSVKWCVCTICRIR